MKIQVKKRKDVSKVFSILLHHGKFTGLSGNRFILCEYADAALDKIKKAGIEVKEL